MNAYPAVAASTAHTICRPPGAPHPPPGKGTSPGPGHSGRDAAPGYGICERKKSRFVSFFRECPAPAKTENP